MMDGRAMTDLPLIRKHTADLLTICRVIGNSSVCCFWRPVKSWRLYCHRYWTLAKLRSSSVPSGPTQPRIATGRQLQSLAPAASYRLITWDNCLTLSVVHRRAVKRSLEPIGAGGKRRPERGLAQACSRWPSLFPMAKPVPDAQLSLRTHERKRVLRAEYMAVKVGDPLPACCRHVQVRNGFIEVWRELWSSKSRDSVRLGQPARYSRVGGSVRSLRTRERARWPF